MEEIIAQQFKTVIKDRGLQQTFISTKTGIENDRLSRILNNKSHIKISEFVNICEVLDLDAKRIIQTLIKARREKGKKGA